MSPASARAPPALPASHAIGADAIAGVVNMSMLVIAAVPVIFAVMPENWTERMSTIKTYDQDESALGRLNAWALAWAWVLVALMRVARQGQQAFALTRRELGRDWADLKEGL